MSYWFKMYFKEIKKKDLFDFCKEVSDDMFQQGNAILENNQNYIPSINFGRTDFEKIDDREYYRMWRIADKNWLYKLFTIDFVYWPKKSLLGIIAELTDDLVAKYALKEFQFQNSCDQDYEYKEWNGIKYFEKVVNEFCSASPDKVNREMNRKYPKEYTTKEIEKHLDYYRKSAIYNHIYQELELEAWLYDCKGKFKRFSLQAVNSQEKETYLNTCLMISRNQKIEETQKYLKLEGEQNNALSVTDNKS